MTRHAVRKLMRFAVLALLVLLVSRSAAADWEPVRLRLGTMAVDDSRYVKDILLLTKEIENRTRGSVRIDWVTGGQLGEDQVMAGLVRDGKLDGGGFTEIGLIALVPDMAAWQYAGMFRDYAEVDRATTAVDPYVRQRFEKQGLRFLLWADLGFAHLFSIDPIADLAELLSKARGGLELPIGAVLTQAITRRQIRAWALPPLFTLAIPNANPRHMTSLRYRYVVGGLVLSNKAWAKLDDKQQEAMLAVLREWQPKIRASWRKETEAGIAALVKARVAIRESSAGELTMFFEAAARTRRQARTSDLVHQMVTSIVGALAAPAP